MVTVAVVDESKRTLVETAPVETTAKSPLNVVAPPMIEAGKATVCKGLFQVNFPNVCPEIPIGAVVTTPLIKHSAAAFQVAV